MESNVRLGAMMGVSRQQVYWIAHNFKLRKNAEGIRASNKVMIEHVKKTCEANGYYDSLRNNSMPEACVEGRKKYWADVKAGKRKCYYKELREKNPEKYQELATYRRSQLRKTIQMEEMRLIYGLPRKTTMTNIVLHKYTYEQRKCRKNASRRGYIIMEDCGEGGERYNIYYDGNTRRSDTFEQIASERGFTVKAWSE